VQLALGRLRTGEAADGEILAGTAVPAIAVAWTQIALAAIAALAWPRPTPRRTHSPGWSWGPRGSALLAIVTSTVTRSAELAQVTTLPALLISFAAPGAAQAASPDSWPGLNLLRFALMEVRQRLRSATAGAPAP
jgi:ABC-2 type transport system permease protein